MKTKVEIKYRSVFRGRKRMKERVNSTDLNRSPFAERGGNERDEEMRARGGWRVRPVVPSGNLLVQRCPRSPLKRVTARVVCFPTFSRTHFRPFYLLTPISRDERYDRLETKKSNGVAGGGRVTRERGQTESERVREREKRERSNALCRLRLLVVGSPASVAVVAKRALSQRQKHSHRVQRPNTESHLSVPARSTPCAAAVVRFRVARRVVGREDTPRRCVRLRSLVRSTPNAARRLERGIRKNRRCCVGNDRLSSRPFHVRTRVSSLSLSRLLLFLPTFSSFVWTRPVRRERN